MITIENVTFEVLLAVHSNIILCYADDLNIYQKNHELKEIHFLKFEGTLPKFELDMAKLAIGELWPKDYKFEAEEYNITDFDGFLKGNLHVGE
jgi:hypothetical protein